jgi:hypothetical protein
MGVNVDMNCRFCKHVLEYEFDDKTQMDSFKCAYWDKNKTVTVKPFVWIWPEMEYYCTKFETSGPNATRVFELEQEVEALRKELEKFE